MIDYALKPPQYPEKEINIEKINSTKDYFTSIKPDDEKIYLKNYKYPYMSSEILSSDFPFLLDKLITNEFSKITNNEFYSSTALLNLNANASGIGELSMINNNSIGDEQGNIVDDSMEENYSICKKETFTGFNAQELEINIEKDISENENNSELIDYLFNVGLNNELNSIQGGYLVKITRSLLHSLYNPGKSCAFIKYICLKNDLITKILSKTQNFYCQDIIFEILMYNEEDNKEENKEENTILDKMKTNILSMLVSALKTQPDGIKDILCDYILNCKNIETIINENFLSIFCNAFNSVTNENILDNFCVIISQIIKQFKNENFINNITSSKIINSHNNSFIPVKNAGEKNNNFNNNFLNNSLNVANFGDNDILIKFINSIIKEINVDLFKSTSTKLNLITMIFDYMTITRNKEFLEYLKTNNFFNFLKNLFFNSKNDMIQTIFLSMLILINEENNDKWFNELLINNNFLNEIVNLNDVNNNNGLKDNTIFVHISKILDILFHNTFSCDILKANNDFEKINNLYNSKYKTYIEQMEKPIGDFKNTSANYGSIFSKDIDVDRDIIKVDEISSGEKLENTKRNVFESNRLNLVKKSSFYSLRFNEKIFDMRDEERIETRDDNFDDMNDNNDNKNMLQILDEDGQNSSKDDNNKNNKEENLKK